MLSALMVLSCTGAVWADVIESEEIGFISGMEEEITVEEAALSEEILGNTDEISFAEVIEEGAPAGRYVPEGAVSVKVEDVKRPAGTSYQGFEPDSLGDHADFLSDSGATPVSELPDCFDGRGYVPHIPGIENQGSFGLCWVFSALANAEFYATRNGIHSIQEQETYPAEDGTVKSYKPIYSPWLFYYYYSHNVNDPLGLIGGDIAHVKSGPGYWGGNSASAALFLSGWCQPVLEKNVEDVPEAQYPLGEDGDKFDYKSVKISDEYAYGYGDVVLDHAYSINSNDRDFIKQQVYDTGAVSVSYLAGGDDHYGNKMWRLPDDVDEFGIYANQMILFNRTVEYRVKEDGTIYDKDDPAPLNPSDCNHGVAIVGYDDNFPKDYFNNGQEGLTPDNDGAWLIRNSWGQDIADEDYGYFWLSYEDPTICNIWSMNFTDYDPKALNYHYDGTGSCVSMVNLSSGVAVANVFDIQKARQYVSAVTLALDSVNVDYTLFLYKVSERGVDSLNSDIKDENLLYSQEGTTGAAGIIKFPIDGDRVYLTPEMTVAVIIVLNKADGSPISLYTDRSDDKGEIYHEAKANASFFYDGEEWIDLYDYANINPDPEKKANWRIKLLTVQDSLLSVEPDYSELYYDTVNEKGQYVEATLEFTGEGDHTSGQYRYEICDKSGNVLTEEEFSRIIELRQNEQSSDKVDIIAKGTGHIVVRFYNVNDSGETDEFYSDALEIKIKAYPTITLEETKADLFTGQDYQIGYKITDFDEDRFVIVFETERDYGNLTLTEEGVVTASGIPYDKSTGEEAVPVKVRVTVCTREDMSAVAVSPWIDIYVKEPVAITEIRFEKESLRIAKGGKASAKVITVPEVNDDTLSFRSSDEKVAVVDAEGMITGVSNGTCEITVTTALKKLQASIKVTVYSSDNSSGDHENTSYSITGVAKVPSWVVSDGTWSQLADGSWIYTRPAGRAADQWLCVFNPYANTNAGQKAYDWFRFDANGIMITGWFTDKDGNVYYLSPVSDGTKGRMLIGRQVIDGKEYYFSEAEGSGTMGALVR